MRTNRNRHLRRLFLTTLLTGGFLAVAAVPAQAANVAGQIDLFRPESGSLIRSFGSAHDATDALAMGDMTNDGFEEVVIANAGGSSENGRIDVVDAFGASISSFGSAYDVSGDRLDLGDITADGFDEVVIANNEGGRIDVHDLFGAVISSFGTAYDDSGDALTVGDVTGDGAEEIVVVNNEGGGRIDVHDLFGDVIASFGNTGYDGDDTVAAGDVTGDGRADVVVANTEGGGRVDVFNGTGGFVRGFSSGVSLPKVMVADLATGTPAEIAVIRRSRPTATPPPTESLAVFTPFGTRIRTVATSFTAADSNRSADAIALGSLNAGPLAEIVVGNV